jgi:hypothetical protein
LLKHAEENEEMIYKAGSEDGDRYRQKARKAFEKMEDLINKYRKNDEESEEDDA